MGQAVPRSRLTKVERRIKWVVGLAYAGRAVAWHGA
jgi:hypothetical protein